MPNLNTFSTLNDLHANDRIQRKLEEEFRSLGYFYERKANQFPDAARNKRLNNELLAQLEAARTERGELYTHDKFFKETQTNRLIHEAIEAAYLTAMARLSES
jgi:hypothetical protein